MSSEEPPAGQQPNPYGPPPGHPAPPPHSPQPPWGPPTGSPAGFQGPPSGPPTHAPWQPTPPPPKGRRNAVIALVAVLVLLVAGGGAAWAFLDRNGDDDGQADDQKSAQVSTSPSTVETSPSEPTTPLTSPGTGGGGETGTEDGPTTRNLRGYVQADTFRKDWEFRWEDHSYNARVVVARDHFDCSEIAADERLDDLGCNRAVSVTYVNERDQVTITHFYLKFGKRSLSRKQAEEKAQAVAEKKDLDRYLTFEGDAVWDGWEQGGWLASRVEGIVIFTGVTAPADADTETVNGYLRWAHTDFKEGLRIRRAF